MCAAEPNFSVMKVWIQVVIACLVAWRGSDARGAGRALPVEAENYVIDIFTGINPDIEWDPSNFLVDLAGVYANCDYVGKRGFVTVDRTTPGGNTIVAIVDNAAGTAADSYSVTRYVEKVFKRWKKTSDYVSQIRMADVFGCSVRPACSGQAVVSCLFSLEGRRAVPETPTQPSIKIVEPPQDEPEGEQRAFAFTKEQYKMAEKLTGKAWDRSHFLEDLSGYETDCSMLYARSWAFAYANRKASERGHQVVGLYGHAQNHGSTTDALRQIFYSFKQLPYAKAVGCSLIPDCPQSNGLTSIVVSCLYMET